MNEPLQHSPHQKQMFQDKMDSAKQLVSSDNGLLVAAAAEETDQQSVVVETKRKKPSTEKCREYERNRKNKRRSRMDAALLEQMKHDVQVKDKISCEIQIDA